MRDPRARAGTERTDGSSPAGDAEALYPLVLLGQVLLHLLPHVEYGAVSTGGTERVNHNDIIISQKETGQTALFYIQVVINSCTQSPVHDWLEA